MVSVGPGALDLDRFEELAAAARDQDAAAAAAALREALALWRGPALARRGCGRRATGAANLDERRLSALEQRIDAELELGLHAQLLPELDGLVREEPLREHRRAQLMVALYRSGRQAEALEVYRQGRRLLAEELGLEPGEEPRRVEKAIPEQDPALAAPVEAPRSPAPGAEPAELEPQAERPLRLLARWQLAALLGALLLAGAIAGLVVAVTGGTAVKVTPNSVAVLDPESGRVKGTSRSGAGRSRSPKARAPCGWACRRPRSGDAGHPDPAGDDRPAHVGQAPEE